jgi:hypothetical protein
MKRLFKFGMLLIIVLLVGLICFTVSAQEANATTYAQDKAGAIQAANVAIDRIYIPVAYEQAFVDDVAYARALVTHAKTKGAVDADFTGLTKLANAENEVKKFAAIQTARNAIDRIPPTAEITSADRGTITEARRLVNIAMQQYGASEFDICWRYDTLVAAEKAANLSGTLSETALPATGAVDAAALVGTLLAGTGALIGIKMRRKHIKTK